jgi:peptidoglycan/xylan/chitin deacetylase (PgdA/CDA1 family)
MHMAFDRKYHRRKLNSLLWGAGAFFSLVALTAHAQSVAFTFDDGPNLEATPRLSAQQRNAAMLAALDKHGVKAALFVTAGNGANQPEGLALARAWGEAGHAIGNHTMTHPDLHSARLTLAQYQQEILDCDRIISTLPGYRKWFRYTFLREGNTPEKRDGMRAFLKQQGYRNAYVSLDTSDWRLNGELVRVLNADPHADVAPIRAAYLAHLKQRALAYRALSQQLQGRDIAQVMLMHHNLINALWLDDAIAMFKDMGWTITTPAVAFDDPVYQLEPDRPAAGQSLLLAMARSLGLGKFEGWQRLVGDGDFEMEALQRQQAAWGR